MGLALGDNSKILLSREPGTSLAIAGVLRGRVGEGCISSCEAIISVINNSMNIHSCIMYEEMGFRGSLL